MSMRVASAVRTLITALFRTILPLAASSGRRVETSAMPIITNVLGQRLLAALHSVHPAVLEPAQAPVNTYAHRRMEGNAVDISPVALPIHNV